MDKISDTLIGLSSFEAEQTLAMCIQKDGSGVDVDRKALWDRKCSVIEQTPGLSIWKGGETFADIGGCDNAKDLLYRLLMTGKERPRAIVFIDEIEKCIAGSGSDSSGVSQDQLASLLTFMQDKEVMGMIFIGPPGAAKSALAKAAGNTANIPTVSLDMGAMKNALVGKSGELIRQGLKIIDAVSQGKTLFIATCNSIGTLPPELRRRFTLGTFFFDLPNSKERKKIWSIYKEKYALTKDQCDPVSDKGWTGAEIKNACNMAYMLDITLTEAAKYIVPVAIAARQQIEALQNSANGCYIDAGKSGIYRKDNKNVSGRKFE
jgi:SpoVK/Ycf46/Vps4 family AAA+-type ATPase